MGRQRATRRPSRRLLQALASVAGLAGFATSTLVPVAAVPAAAAAAPPARILCLSASATQMLYMIGAGKQVVGVDKYSTWPAGAPRTKLTGFETSAEDYLPWHPDLVVFAFREGTLVQQLADLHIRSLVLPPPSSLAGVDAQISALGRVTGHVQAAARAERAMSAALEASVRSAAGRGRGKTYYLEVDPTYYTGTSHTFVGAELSLFGMRDVADAAGKSTAWPQVSAEYVLKANPDYVFLADTVCCHQTPAAFAKRPGFAALAAVRLHQVFAVNDSVASEWGPHTVEAFTRLVAGVLAK